MLPPSVIEDAIRNTIAVPGHTACLLYTSQRGLQNESTGTVGLLSGDPYGRDNRAL